MRGNTPLKVVIAWGINMLKNTTTNTDTTTRTARTGRTKIARTLGSFGAAAGLVAGAIAFPTAAMAGPIGECDPGTSKIVTTYQSSAQSPAGTDRTTNTGSTAQSFNVTVSATQSYSATTSASVGFSVDAIAASVNGSLGYSVTTTQDWSAGSALGNAVLQPGQSAIVDYGFETLTVIATQQNCDSTGTYQSGESTLATLPQGTYKNFNVG